jgi:acyl carrier protein
MSPTTHRPNKQRSWSHMAASEQEILAGLAEIVNEETGIDAADVQPEKSFTDDLDIDSLSMMTIVVNAEEKFGVRIPDDDVKGLSTVGDAVSYIAKASS